MKTCEGCGYEFTSSLEIFGSVGQAFCFDCFVEERELAKLREPLERERETLQDKVETETATRSTRERLSDIQEELDCLNVPYQRKWSVIGRAAA